MQRPDTIDGLFHDGDPATGLKGTPVTAAWLNALLANGAFLSGTTEPPDNSLGGQDDYYYCTASSNLYGPKTTTWPGTGTNMIGPVGPQGVPGNPYKAYASLALANADLGNIPANYLIWVNADPTPANVGFWVNTNGILVQSSNDRTAALETGLSTVITKQTALWEKHLNLVLSLGTMTISSVVSTSVTFSSGGGFYVNGKDNFIPVPALSAITLTNLQCCYLDISTLNAPTWSSPGSVANVKDSTNKIITFVNLSGKLYSPVASVMRCIKDAEDVYNVVDPATITAAIDKLFVNQVNSTIVPASETGVPVVSGKTGYSITFSWPASFFLNFKDSYKTVPALSTITLANLQCCYLDITNVDAITWSSSAGMTSLKPDKTRLVIAINFYGRLWSPLPAVQKLLSDAYDLYAKPSIDATLSALVKLNNQTIVCGSSGKLVTILSISGTTVIFSINTCFYSNGIDSAATVPELVNQTLTNTGKLYLDITTPTAPVWTTTGPASSTKLLVAVNYYAVMFSPLASLQTSFNDAANTYRGADFSALVKLDNRFIAASSGSALYMTINSIVSNTVIFSIAAGFYDNGVDSFFSLPTLNSQSLNNVGKLYLDVTSTLAPVWTTTGPSSGTKLLIIANYYGKLYSPLASIQSAINAAYTVYNSPGGTVAEVLVAQTGGDYPTITSALAAIADASVSKRYKIHVADGFYNEVGPNGLGLELKDYVDIVGVGRGRVTIKGPEAPLGSEYLYDTIHRPATCVVSGVTLIAYKNKYCIHGDSTVNLNYDFTIRDSDLQHYGGNEGYSYEIGLGLYQNQKFTVDNCNLLGLGLFLHGPAHDRKITTSWKLILNAVQGRSIYLSDFLEYLPNQVNITGCVFNLVTFDISKSYYDANPGDTLYNRGYFNQSLEAIFTSSKIGRIAYSNVFTTDTILIKKLTVPGLNARCINKGSGGISKGQAVKLLANPSAPNTYPAAAQMVHNIAPWDGSGIFAGVAEDDMAVDTVKTYQYSGTPLASASASGGAIVYGDDLEINSSGVLVKRTTGQLRANAIDALSSGTGLIAVKLAGI